ISTPSKTRSAPTSIAISDHGRLLPRLELSRCKSTHLRFPRMLRVHLTCAKGARKRRVNAHQAKNRIRVKRSVRTILDVLGFTGLLFASLTHAARANDQCQDLEIRKFTDAIGYGPNRFVFYIFN